MYVSKNFQRYNEMFNPMNFDPSNHSLKIQNSIKIPTPKVGVNLGVCGFIPSHFFTFWESKCDSQVAFSIHTFPCPCFCHEPKIKVVTVVLYILQVFKFYLSNIFKYLFWQINVFDFILFRIFFQKM
jgi:hypothetical protein